MKRTVFLAPLLAALALSLTACSSYGNKHGGWTPLFNGQDLTGWKQYGGNAKYRVEDNQIVGTCVPNSPNSFLCTERKFANFILELEFKVEPGLNSGVQIRSQVFDHETTFDNAGKIIKIPAHRVHGYQIEIDTTSRAWTGGLYEEGRRGWLNDLKNNEPARQAFKQNEWNKFRIEANGNSIKTFLNGIPAANHQDSALTNGFIGLQVHGVGKNDKPMEIRFRDLRLKELP